MANMFQTAPWPIELEDIIKHTELWPGWHLWLEADMLRDPATTHGAEGRGTTLVIQTKTYNTYDYPSGQNYRVRHLFPVPAATFNRQSWLRWLFDRFADVQLHEAMEAFVVDGERPFAPLHGPGDNPYVVHERATDKQVNTSYLGAYLGIVKESGDEGV